ncbi:MAG TPA: hypothetical protein VE398_22940 [Acidobacteriota bacterium]|nr:hypothetical protein [Acidobacteriota bacterium]
MLSSKKSITVIIILLVAFAIPLFAAKFWEAKEFTKWTEKECLEILSKSPWAFSNGFGNVGPAVLPTIDGTTSTADPSRISPSATTFGERESSQIFEFRILTAKPVRAAIAQLQVLRNPSLSEQAKRIVDAKPGDQIIIQFEYRSQPPGSSAVHEIHSYFLHATLSDFRTETYLASDKVDLVPVKDYFSPNDKRPKPAFVFPRYNEKGEAWFTGNEKTITFRSLFQPEVAGKKQKYEIFVKMNPKDMRFDKEFAF